MSDISVLSGPMLGAVSETSALKVSGVAADYGARRVITGIDFSVLPAETFGLIGLNGVGKTTLIKTVLGLKEYAEGHISIRGQDRMSEDSKNNIAYLPERFDPPWFLTGYEFVEFSLSFYKKTVTRDDVDLYADKLQLDKAALTRKMQTYSKGMRQKLGLLATFMTDCQVLILDEPMSGLDPMARSLVKNLFIEARAKGQTIVLSSHILADMDELCDRVAIIHAGVMVYLGTPAQLRAEMGGVSLEKAFLDCIGKTGIVVAA